MTCRAVWMHGFPNETGGVEYLSVPPAKAFREESDSTVSRIPIAELGEFACRRMMKREKNL
jgi:hypothetical protein